MRPGIAVAPGERAIGGVGARELAAAYGTPLLVLDTDVFDAAVATFARAGRAHETEVAYAGKALLFVALARRIAASPLALDVCSLGELVTAERAGMPPERLILHGCAKTDDELAAALAGRVGRIVVDHLDELATLARLAAASAGPRLDVVLRVNTGIEAHTHAYVRTGGEESKFGFGPHALDAALDATLAIDRLRLVGIHSHLGSQIFDGGAYAASLPIALDAVVRARDRGAPATDLVIGGGFGVDPQPHGERFDIDALLARLGRDVRALCGGRGAPPRLGIEPGRSIVAAAGTSLYRVAATKTQGRRRFAIVDGGIADNPRPALYGAYHHPELASRRSSADLVETTVCGRSCENDRLVVAPLPGDLAVGDLLALGTTGAYTYSMAGNYNRFPKPAVVFAGGGEHRVVVRRQRTEDVLALDVLDG